MRGGKGIALGLALLAVYVRPAIAEANGDHLQMGDLHFDPLIVVGVAVFVGLITLMFVAQWVRLNAARRRSGGAETPQRQAEEGEELADFDEYEY